MKTERRMLGGEVRAGEGRNVGGYAAVFYRADDPGTEYLLFEDTYERIMPGAFDLAGADVRALFNHDPNMVLGRTSSGTLSLSLTSKGLRYDIDTPDTTVGEDVRKLIARGDVNGSSFAFRTLDDKWYQEKRGDKVVTVRELRKVSIDGGDVGPVTYPAYASSTTAVRSSGEVDELRAAAAAALADSPATDEPKPAGPNAAERSRRLRMMELEIA